MEREIVYVAGIHGDEILPIKALKDIDVDFVLGNPKAVEKVTRYIDEDLNASFGTDHSTIESKRAKEILKEIPPESLVVDFHTTMLSTRPFVIIVDENMMELALRTGVRDIVFMSYDIKKGRALISHREGISIELGMHDDIKAAYTRTQEIVRNISSKEKVTERPRVYEVYDTINELGKYKNFKEDSEGFIPILAGSSSYSREGIYGLKARVKVL